jgi:hypothetical protein
MLRDGPYGTVSEVAGMNIIELAVQGPSAVKTNGVRAATPTHILRAPQG